MASPGSSRRWRPFWLHQGAEYLVGLVIVSSALQSPSPTVAAIAGGVVVLNAALVDGPLGAFRAVDRPLHRWLDVAVIAMLVVLAALPFVDIDNVTRTLMIGVAAMMGFIWMSTNFETAGAARARRRAARRAAVEATLSTRTGVPPDRSEALGRVAGRLVGRARQTARKRQER
ncbi:hypothetical protein BH24ACT5_BH24ACT5_12790 [soil metagenome]